MPIENIKTYENLAQEAINSKSQECEDYAENLIILSQTNPVLGLNVDPIKYAKRVKSREKDKANKLAGEITLTQDEKDQAKTDQKLSEYEVKCWAASDKAIKEVNKGTDPELIMVLDVSTLTTWPIWTPPV